MENPFVTWFWSASRGLGETVKFDELYSAALASPLGRARICLHQNDLAFAQCMLVCVTRKSSVPIHRHLKGNECYVPLHGAACLLLFDDGIVIEEEFRLVADSIGQELGIFGVPKGRWHRLTVNSDYFVFLEFRDGPYEGEVFDEGRGAENSV